MRICVSLGAVSLSECRRVLAEENLVEIRLDLLGVEAPLEELLAMPASVIVSYRKSLNENGRQLAQRQHALKRAIAAGADFIDLDLEDTLSDWQEIRTFAKSQSCRIIVSYHNYSRTPGRKELSEMIAACFDRGADIAKVACCVLNNCDNARLLGLLDYDRPLIVVGIGELGTVTRVAAPLLGSYLTYACVDPNRATAPGQLPAEELRAIYQILSRSAGLL